MLCVIELARAWQFAENETISMRVHALQGESMARHKILYIFMLEASQDGDFPQSSLAVRLVLEGADLFDGNFLASCDIVCRAAAERSAVQAREAVKHGVTKQGCMP